MSKIIIGYIKRFTHLNTKVKELLSDEPKEGSIYRIIFDEAIEPKDDGPGREQMYQIYIGAENNKAQMSTIFLGPSLVGTYYDKWDFDISEVTKENYLEFDYKTDELPKLKDWLDSKNEDLKEIMTKNPVKVEVMGDELPDMDKVMAKVRGRANDIDRSLERLSKALTTISNRDIGISMVLSDMLVYIASTYKDKYENAGSANIARDFLLASDSPDVAMFNALKYLQRYSTKGFKKSRNTQDLYKAIHYIMFELQRVKQQTSENEA